MRHPRISALVVLCLLLLVTACSGDPTNGTGVIGDSTTADAPPPGENITPRFFTIQEGTARYSVYEELLGQEISTRTTIGVTSEIEGRMELWIDPANGGVALGENQITVNLESLTSDESRRDERIRREWLESTTYPLATFVATEIQGFPAGIQEGQPATFQLVGDLTVREITNPVVFTTTATLNGNTLSGTASSQIMMRDYGFEPPSVMGVIAVTDGVTVTLEFVMQAETP